MSFMKLLRALNYKRVGEFRQKMPANQFDNDLFSLAFSSNELSGEVGEFQNKIKKFMRMEMGFVTKTDPLRHELRRDLEDEAADVLICLDLVCIELGIDLEKVTKRKFNETSDKHGFHTRFEDEG